MAVNLGTYSILVTAESLNVRADTMRVTNYDKSLKQMFYHKSNTHFKILLSKPKNKHIRFIRQSSKINTLESSTSVHFYTYRKQRIAFSHPMG